MSHPLEAELRRIRREFDERFAHPVGEARAEHEHVLAVSYGETPLAIALRDAGALLKTPSITPVSSPDRALLGLAGVRGTITAVYDLRRLLGLGGRAPDELRWTLLCATDARIGVAFESVDGYHRVAPEAIGDPDESDGGRRVVRLPDGLRPVIDPRSLLDQIRRGRGRNEPEDEET